MSRNSALNAVAVLVAFFASFVVLELGLRWMVGPSPNSWGRLFGIELPPLRLAVDETAPKTGRDSWYGDLKVDGQRITYGDLWGHYRPDPILGYAPQEGVVSRSGWWQSNELGARSRRPTPQQVPAGHRRVLVFGESHAVGSRVPQEDAWPTVLDQRDNGLEVINLAVDGYGMGQSYLRFQAIGGRLDYDAVVLMFAPSDDLWRDVNVARDLAEPGWNTPPMPRFVLTPAGIAPVHYQGKADDETSIRQHVTRHDLLHCEPWDGGWSIIAKFGVSAYCTIRKRRIFVSLKKPDSEAMAVVTRIFVAMENEIESSGKMFLLVILATDKDLLAFKRAGEDRAEWQRIASAACGAVTRCLDLSHDLLQRAETLDRGYDGTHYGPSANRLIADLIEARLLEDLSVALGSSPGAD